MIERYKLTKKVGILGIIGNLFLFVIKIIIGYISNSMSMIGDAINSAGDVFASFMTWLGNKISSVPNDSDHNYGHGKAEYIFSLLIGISMMIVSVKLLYDSFFSIINHNKVLFSWNLVLIAIITILTKLLLYLYSKYAYAKTDNLLIKSNMFDHRNDIFITSFTLLAIILSYYNINFIDGIVGIGISIWIFISGMKLYKESYDVLMDQAIDNDSKNKILKIIKSHKEIKRIGDIYSIPIGYKYIIVVKIYVNGKMRTIESHKIADNLEEEIIKSLPIIENVLIHVEPYIEKNS